jgi:hypothetical protein
MAAMLDHCANPGCARRFRKLEDGKLFLVEVDVAEAALPNRAAGAGRFFRHLERYWLCDPCASVLTLTFEQNRGVVAVPLAPPVGRIAAGSVRSRGVVSNRLSARGGANEA